MFNPIKNIYVVITDDDEIYVSKGIAGSMHVDYSHIKYEIDVIEKSKAFKRTNKYKNITEEEIAELFINKNEELSKDDANE